MQIIDTLRLVPFLTALDDRVLEQSASFWHHRSLLPGEVLWEQNTWSESLAILLRGKMAVCVNDRQINHVQEGELVGELNAFTIREQRIATLRAEGACQLLLMPLDKMSDLAREHLELYNTVLDVALQQSVRRINAADLQIARHAQGSMPAPRRRPESSLRKLWDAITRPEPKARPPSVITLLRQLHGLFGERDAVIGALGAAMEPVWVQAGQPLFLEGETGSSVFLIGDTEIEILRNVRGGDARKLVVLGPGSLVGTGVLIPGNARRSASGVPTMNGWVYEMTHARHQELTGQVERAWKEALMGEIRDQIVVANQILSEVIVSEDAR